MGQEVLGLVKILKENWVYWLRGSPEANRSHFELSDAQGKVFVHTAITDQTNHNKNFESVASQRFQNFYWFGFECKAL